MTDMERIEERIWEVLPTEQALAMSPKQIAEAAQVAPGTVRGALYQWRILQAVRCTPSELSERIQLYWKTARDRPPTTH